MKKSRNLFLLTLTLGLTIRIFVATHFITKAWIDEIWVVLNPAFRMLTGVGFVERDWSWQVRDYLPPTLIYSLMKFFNFKNGIEASAILRTIISFLNFTSIVAFLIYLKNIFQLKNAPWIAAIFVFLIPDLIHYSPTFDLSVLGTPFLLFGITLAFGKERTSNFAFYLGCIFMSISCLIRFQFGIFIVVLLLGLLLEGRLRKFISLSVIGLFIIVLDILFNSYKYGNFVFPLYNYFLVNTKGGVAASYGVSPFYLGLEFLWKWITEPVFICFIIFLPLMLKKGRWISLASVLYLFVHLLIGHKEYRFFYTAAVTLSCLSLVSLQKWYEMTYKKNVLIFFTILFFIFAGFRGLKKVDWHAFEVPAKLEALAGTQTNLRGLITMGWGGIYQGGNFYVYKPVPYEFAENQKQLFDKKLDATKFSHLILPENMASPCAEKISTERGGALYFCRTEELMKIL